MFSTFKLTSLLVIIFSVVLITVLVKGLKNLAKTVETFKKEFESIDDGVEALKAEENYHDKVKTKKMLIFLRAISVLLIAVVIIFFTFRYEDNKEKNRLKLENDFEKRVEKTQEYFGVNNKPYRITFIETEDDLTKSNLTGFFVFKDEFRKVDRDEIRLRYITREGRVWDIDIPIEKITIDTANISEHDSGIKWDFQDWKSIDDVNLQFYIDHYLESMTFYVTKKEYESILKKRE